MEKIIIGVLHEGSEDIATIKALVERIAISCRIIIPIEYSEFCAHGPITTKLKLASQRFFHEQDCGAAIFLSDNDTDQERCCDVRKFVNDNPQYRIIVGCPEPAIESWLINEENAVRNYFQLDIGFQVKNSGKHPKDLLNQLIASLPDQAIGKTDAEIYFEISQNLNLQRLKQQDRDANSFLSAIENALKVLTTQPLV